MTGARRPFRIALHAGVYLARDGIGGAIACKIDLLDRLRHAGADVDLRVFCRGSDIPDGRVRVLESVADLLLEPFFAEADLHCYEYGIQYDLFDSAFVLSPSAAALGIYHNVTPPELVPESERETMRLSLIQRYNLFEMHHVACQSEFNRLDLLGIGFPPERLSVVPQAVPSGRLARVPGKLAARREAGPVGFLFVGRFVQAKGVTELLDAAARLAAEPVPAFRLTVVSNRTFSDAGLLARMEEQIRPGQDAGWLRLLTDATDEAVLAEYRAADCLVIPSHHEGFCLPVVEALSAGCHVVASDAGNLPYILDGLGLIVPVRNPEALAAAMRAVLVALAGARAAGRPPTLPTGRGPMSAASWEAAVEQHLGGFSRASFDRGFAAAMRAAVTGAGQKVPDWLDPGPFEAMAGL